MNSTTANIISTVFHPMLMVITLFVMMMKFNAAYFDLSSLGSVNIFLIQILLYSVLMPSVALAMMYKLGMIGSIQIHDKQQRFIPFIIASILYLWMFINVLNNTEIDRIFPAVILGSIISLFICFFSNIFLKVSVHAAGMGGMLAAFGLFVQHYNMSAINVFGLTVNVAVFFIVLLIISAVVMYSRTVLKVHSRQELFLGFLIGIFSQVIAYLFIVGR